MNSIFCVYNIILNYSLFFEIYYPLYIKMKHKNNFLMNKQSKCIIIC